MTAAGGASPSNHKGELRVVGTSVTREVELLLERALGATIALAHVRSSKALRVGAIIDLPGGHRTTMLGREGELFRLEFSGEVLPFFEKHGDTPLPPYVVGAGRAVPVPYNGSVARLSFGFLSVSRVRRWLKEGGFDVLHVHEPGIPSLSLLACWVASWPIVATVHTAIPRSRVLLVTYPVLRTALEKINGRIAVSEAARTTLVEHIGCDAVVIPNGVATRRYRKAEPLPGWPGPGGAIGFLGRLDEPRKGLSVLLKAFEILGPQRPGLRLLVAGPSGDADEVLHKVPAELRDRVVLLGQVSEDDKVRVLHSVDVFCSPNTGGESFGIVTAEAMAAGVPVVASDIDAFRQVLRGGEAGELFATGDAADMARAAGRLLDNPPRRWPPSPTTTGRGSPATCSASTRPSSLAARKSRWPRQARTCEPGPAGSSSAHRRAPLRPGGKWP